MKRNNTNHKRLTTIVSFLVCGSMIGSGVSKKSGKYHIECRDETGCINDCSATAEKALAKACGGKGAATTDWDAEAFQRTVWGVAMAAWDIIIFEKEIRVKK